MNARIERLEVESMARRQAASSIKSGFKAAAKIRPQEDDDIGPEAWEEIRRQMEKDE